MTKPKQLFVLGLILIAVLFVIAIIISRAELFEDGSFRILIEGCLPLAICN